MARRGSAGHQEAGKALGLEGGPLCQLIHSPDYNVFPNSAVFESNFVQVTKKGKWVNITNVPTIVIMGVTSSDPCLPLPNVLLMAKYRKSPPKGTSESRKRPAIELTRMLPLRYVRLSVHNVALRILRVQTMTRKVYFLQLHQEHPRVVFTLWSRLADILQWGLSITTKDPAIRIRHSLVPSSASSSASSSSAEGSERSPRRSPSLMKKVKKVKKKVSGVSSNISGTSPRKKEQQRKMSFHADLQEDAFAVPNDIRVLFYDMPPPLVCARCRGRLSKASPRRGSSDPGTHSSDLDLLRWMDDQSYGLWQQETPAWLQPLCRLSSLAAANAKYSPS
nr:protein FAM71F2 [Pogona vitticeps]